MVLPVVNVDLKTEVSKEATDKIVQVIIDCVGPFSESLGLVKDLISLYRAKVGLKIAELFRKRAEILEGPPKPIPLKGVVKFFEAASLEDPEDDRMISMWADLLVSAAERGSEQLPRYVGILSELTKVQAELLEHIYTHGNDLDGHVMEDVLVAMRYHHTDLIRRFILDADINHPTDIMQIVKRHLSYCGIISNVVTISQDREIVEYWAGYDLRAEGFSTDDIDLDILRSLGLIDKQSIDEHIGNIAIQATYYIITPLGADLFERCNRHKIE